MMSENTVEIVVNTELAYAQNLPAIFYEGERPRSFAPPFLLAQKTGKPGKSIDKYTWQYYNECMTRKLGNSMWRFLI